MYLDYKTEITTNLPHTIIGIQYQMTTQTYILLHISITQKLHKIHPQVQHPRSSIVIRKAQSHTKMK